MPKKIKVKLTDRQHDVIYTILDDYILSDELSKKEKKELQKILDKLAKSYNDWFIDFFYDKK